MPVTKPEKAGSKASPPGSLAELFIAHELVLLRYARQLVRREEVAQDIVQEAFVRLHPRFEAVRHPRAWLYRTVHNLAVNHQRSQRKIVPLLNAQGEDLDPADSSPLPDQQVERLEAIGLTRLFLQDLDARSRELIRLKFEEGLSYKEMSARTGLSISNVGYLLHHALKDLGTELEAFGLLP